MEAVAAPHPVPVQATEAGVPNAGLELGPHSLIDELRENCDAMARHALASGIPVPANVLAVAERARAGDPGVDLRNLVRAHDRLLRLVAPATPRTIRLLDDKPTGWLGILGPVRLIRHMVVAVVILLAVFIGLASTQWINATSGDILTSDGDAALANEVFFLAAGGIGAAFAALFRAYHYIAEGTYDPKYESSYWIRFILGLMAGVLLPALVPISSDASPVTRPVLALIGGFSAGLVYTILQRLVDVVASLFQGASGDSRPVAADPFALTGSSERIAVVAELTKLGEQLRAAGTPQAAAAVDAVLRTLLPDHLGDDVELGDLQTVAPSPPPTDPVSTTT
jgi:hypothetical protein